MWAYPLTLDSVPGLIQQGTHWVLCLLSGCQMSWAIIILMPAAEQQLLHTEKQRVVAADESLLSGFYVGSLSYGWSSVILCFKEQFTPKFKFSNNPLTHHSCWWEVGWGFVVRNNVWTTNNTGNAVFSNEFGISGLPWTGIKKIHFMLFYTF